MHFPRQRMNWPLDIKPFWAVPSWFATTDRTEATSQRAPSRLLSQMSLPYIAEVLKKRTSSFVFLAMGGFVTR